MAHNPATSGNASVRRYVARTRQTASPKPASSALRGARSRAAHALAAPIARVIARMALAALGLPGDPVHVPVHVRVFASRRGGVDPPLMEGRWQQRVPAGPAATDHRGRGRVQRLPDPAWKTGLAAETGLRSPAATSRPGPDRDLQVGPDRAPAVLAKLRESVTLCQNRQVLSEAGADRFVWLLRSPDCGCG
jgi:hypothetical protein